MKQLFEADEFNKIIAGEKYEKVDSYVKIPHNAFEKLTKFIKEFTSSNGDKDILDFFKLGYSRNFGEVVNVGKYVGMIQFPNGDQIQILPKVDLATEDKTDSKGSKRIFLNMLKCLKDFPPTLFREANLNIERMNLYEYLIAMFVGEVRELLRRGVKSNYVTKEDNITCLKGKLLFSKHLRKNIVHKERFFVQFDEYDVNTPENKLLKSTLLKLSQISGDADNKKWLHKLIMEFDGFEESVNYDMDFSKVVIDRNNHHYESLMQWCEVFLKNKSFSVFSGDGKARSMLFPMNDVYESYVAKNMRCVYSEYGLGVYAQEKHLFLFNDNDLFRLKPDIVVRRKGHAPIIMDTKWKWLTNNEAKNYNISQADMYQMFAYSKQYGAHDIWLLYPWNEEAANIQGKVFSSKDAYGNETRVHVFMIKVDRIEENLLELKSQLEWFEN